MRRIVLRVRGWAGGAWCRQGRRPRTPLVPPQRSVVLNANLCEHARSEPIRILFRPVAKGGRLGAKRLTDQSVCDIVKAYAERVGLKSADFGAHSLRAGFLTSAARRGASVFKMRDVSRHKSMDVLQAYVRDADLFRDHAGAGLL
jgi:integrase